MECATSGRRLLVGVVIGVVVVACAAGALGFHRSPRVGAFPLGAKRASSIGVVLPTYENCGVTPQFEPAILQGCLPCAPRIIHVAWTVWTTTVASGTGMTEDRCMRRGSPPAHAPPVEVVLRDPVLTSFCARNAGGVGVEFTRVVFTQSNVVKPITFEPGGCRSDAPRAGERR